MIICDLILQYYILIICILEKKIFHLKVLNQLNSTCAQQKCWPAIHINGLRHKAAKSLAQDWLSISEVTYENQSELRS